MNGPTNTRRVVAFQEAIAESLRRALGATVTLERALNWEAFRSARATGTAAVYILGWWSASDDFGYPSFALGLAHEYFMSDPDVKALVESGDVNAVEQMLLEKALLIPIFFE
jgi:hypothetical protein